MSQDRARNALFNQLHDVIEARVWRAVSELRGEREGSREILRLSQSEAWSISRERKKYYEGYVLASPGRGQVDDDPGDRLSNWTFSLTAFITNAIILHADCVIAASDALGIPDLLQSHLVRRVMES